MAEGLAEVIRQRIDVRFVHASKFEKLLVRFGGGGKHGAKLGHLHAKFRKNFGGQTIGQRRARRSAEHLAEIGHRVSSDGEGKFGLLGAGTLESGNGKCANIQDGGERTDPGLIVVLGAEVRENRIRKMGLKQFGAPELPFFQQIAQSFFASGIGVAAKKFARGRGRSGTRIEQRNIGFAAAKSAIDERQIADDRGQKTEPETSIPLRREAAQCPSEATHRRDQE